MVNYKIAYTPSRGNFIALVLIFSGFVADIASKFIVSSLQVKEDIIPGLLKISVVKNTGLAFSFLKAYPYAALVINIIVFIILIMIWKKMNLTFLAISIGGALGNLIERILSGGVTDFISVSSFPIFNVGDILIFTGIALTVIFHQKNLSRPSNNIGNSPALKNVIIKK